MLLPFVPEYRKRAARPLKRTTRPPAPAAVTVVAVAFVDDNHAYWKFSSPVISFDDVSGLVVGGNVPVAVEEISAEGWLLVAYDSAISVGNSWEASGDVAITFASGEELELPQSGTVVS